MRIVLAERDGDAPNCDDVRFSVDDWAIKRLPVRQPFGVIYFIFLCGGDL